MTVLAIALYLIIGLVGGIAIGAILWRTDLQIERRRADFWCDRYEKDIIARDVDYPARGRKRRLCDEDL